MKLPFDEDPLTGRKWTWHEHGDGWLIAGEQDIRPIMAENAALYNAVGDYRPYANHDMHRVASIPLEVAERLIAEHGWDFVFGKDRSRLKKWLNDPENRGVRTKPGKL